MKLTKKQRKQLIPFARRAHEIENEFWEKIRKIEQEMEKAIGIEGIEFFMTDWGIIGIGNADRTMELVFLEDLPASSGLDTEER